jgi:hypothetical protein
MITLENMKLAALALGSVVFFIAAVAKKYQRDSLLYDPMDEMFLHLFAAIMPALLIIFADQFGKPTFMALGGALTGLIAAYYLIFFERNSKKIDAAFISIAFATVTATIYYMAQHL